MTQEELGRLVGVQKAQISKLESSANSATIDTIIKITTMVYKHGGQKHKHLTHLQEIGGLVLRMTVLWLKKKKVEDNKKRMMITT